MAIAREGGAVITHQHLIIANYPNGKSKVIQCMSWADKNDMIAKPKKTPKREKYEEFSVASEEVTL